jgi:hypothetical protein
MGPHRAIHIHTNVRNWWIFTEGSPIRTVTGTRPAPGGASHVILPDFHSEHETTIPFTVTRPYSLVPNTKETHKTGEVR